MVRKSPIRKKLGANGLPLPSTYLKKHAGLRLRDKKGVLRVLKKKTTGALYWAPASKASPKRMSGGAKRKSPKRKSKSPKRKSPKRKSKSPKRKSPKRRSGKRKSPKRKSKSPKRKSSGKKRKSPKRKSSGKKRKSPKRKSPKRRSSGKKKRSPKRKSKSPKRKSKSPKRRSSGRKSRPTLFLGTRRVSPGVKAAQRKTLMSHMTNSGGVKKGHEKNIRLALARAMLSHGLAR